MALPDDFNRIHVWEQNEFIDFFDDFEALHQAPPEHLSAHEEGSATIEEDAILSFRNGFNRVSRYLGERESVYGSLADRAGRDYIPNPTVVVLQEAAVLELAYITDCLGRFDDDEGWPSDITVFLWRDTAIDRVAYRYDFDHLHHNAALCWANPSFRKAFPKFLEIMARGDNNTVGCPCPALPDGLC